MSRRVTTAALVGLLVLLLAAPLVLSRGDFAGTDDKATAAIEASDPGYRPWYGSLFEPSGEVESGLFALQAGLGCGVLGYVIGYYRGRSRSAAALAAPAPTDA